MPTTPVRGQRRRAPPEPQGGRPGCRRPSGQARVIVAPLEPSYRLNRVVAALQYYSRKVEPLLVKSVEDACYALGSNWFEFLPVEDDERMRWERTALTALAAIDAQGRKEAEDYRRTSADLRQALPGWRRSLALITVSDLFNTMLRHAEVSDADLSIRCPRCHWATSLAECLQRGRRQTIYSCPRCGAGLIEVVPLPRTSSEASGYSLAGFDVTTRADITYNGIVLPKSPTTDATGRS